MEKYTLPNLPYEYNSLEPHIDEQTLQLHHDKHHAGYVKSANAALAKLTEMREQGNYSDIKSVEKDLTFHVSGHLLHSLFWINLCPASKCQEPNSGRLFEQIKNDFGSFEIFKEQFSATALAVEGSGWCLLVWDSLSKSLIILQVENHQKLTIWSSKILLVLDVWEHAYYLKYQNKRNEFIENFWKIINWKEVENRL